MSVNDLCPCNLLLFLIYYSQEHTTFRKKSESGKKLLLLLTMDPTINAPPPPPPPPSYAAATQDMSYGGYASQHQGEPLHSPTRRGPPGGDDGFSESIDPAKYKTRLCQAYMMGTHCTFGGRCAFAHGNGELRQSIASPLSQAPPPPSYHESFPGHHYPSGQSSPLHSRPQTPRGMAANGGAPAADPLYSPTRGIHPRNSLPGSPITAGDQMVYPSGATQRFRNEPYSPTGFVFENTQQGPNAEDGSVH